jgi:hypothetical protein
MALTMVPLLLEFENEEDKNHFVAFLAGTKWSNVKLNQKPNIISDEERTVCLFVSGKQIEKGPLSKIRNRFKQEVASHSATVEIREKSGDKWHTILRQTR